MLLSLVTLGALAISVSAEASIHKAVTIPGYGIETIQWEFPTPDGRVVYVNGTAQDAVLQLAEMHPNATAFKRDGGSVNSALAKRTDFSGAKYNCLFYTPGGQQASPDQIRIGITYLRHLKGRPTNGPGPGNCGRVSCAYNSAIWWCNDENNDKTLESWGSIADGAQFIVDHCSYRTRKIADEVHGQVFHRTNWNVVFGWAKC